MHRATEAHTIKEVRLMQLGGVQIDNLTLIQTQHQPKPRFEVEFSLRTQKRSIRAMLITTRNKPYQLRNLNRGIQFLRSVFLKVNVVEVKL